MKIYLKKPLVTQAEKAFRYDILFNLSASRSENQTAVAGFASFMTYKTAEGSWKAKNKKYY
ncbi:hypothetical protein [Pedobacter hartonius]|uniref:Uncharacterized protein n=1 Tax=Pedobacter hartonius TaxID=425514 RepID=A0A1H3ZN25_9SPHI|nr:hypothetical protein [Pedobacter hartonius]SEA25100.1 hypothetical protein SAMN05443550_102424 [Pedobacter hartonius]